MSEPLRPDSPLGRRESLWWAFALALVAIAVFVPHVLHGGFHNDDWYNHRLAADGLGTDDFRELARYYAHRPVYVLYSPLVHALFRSSTGPFVAYMVGLGWLVAFACFSLLRRLGVEAWVAGAVGAFLLVWPSSDGVRLWLAASGMSLALALTLGAYLLSVSAFRRAALWRHAAAVLLLCVSVLLFEVAVGLVLVGVVVYLRVAPTVRAALLRWAADLVTVGATVAIWTLHASSSYDRNGGAALARNGFRYLRDVPALLGQTFWPDGHRHDPLGVAVVGVAVALLVVAVRRADLRRWAALIGAGFVATLAGWAPFVAGDPRSYRPLYEGGQNRTNVAAAVGFGLLVVAVVGGVVTLLAGRRRVASFLAISAVTALLAGNAWQTRADIRAWDAAYAVADDGVATVRRLVPAPRPDTLLLVYGMPGAYDDGIPVLGGSRDTTFALRVHYDRDDLRGASMIVGTRLRCDASGLSVSGGSLENIAVPYGTATAVDLASGSVTEIRSAADCALVARTFVRGPALVKAADS